MKTAFVVALICVCAVFAKTNVKAKDFDDDFDFPPALPFGTPFWAPATVNRKIKFEKKNYVY